MTDDQLRADRDRLAKSLFALRGRLAVSAQDERLPEPVRHLLACLLHGLSIERATAALAETSAGDSIHYDPATHMLREAGVVVTWGKPTVFRDEEYETND